ncbi:hypothetical protein HXA34_20250 [Salipaludibacillus agaradhaerens]|jgi:hypothetical protein|nr:hypothetical protein [Salipaludibacillus agaradhaerens]MCR6120653.1 hypothetical protein [Salipaludibacillus agaradhaerens]
MPVNIDSTIISIVIGVVMLLGGFATIRSESSSQFDHNFALLLLIAGVASLGFGLGLIDSSQLHNLIP